MTGIPAPVAEDADRLAVQHVFWFMPETEPDRQLDMMRGLLAAIAAEMASRP